MKRDLLETELEATRRRLGELEAKLARIESDASSRSGSAVGAGVSIAGVETMTLRLGPDRKIAYLNSSLARFLGIDKADAVGEPISTIARLLPDEMRVVLGAMESSDSTVRDGHGRVFIARTTLHESGSVDIAFIDVTSQERLKALVRRYVSAELAEEDERTFRFPERRWMTVSFVDLRGFTAMSEGLAPEEVRSLVNAYLEEAIGAIDNAQGTVDKVIGDEVMALFGAPRPFADHALRAVLAACDQIERIARLREKFLSVGQDFPECGAGVNTGDMVVGTLGTESRSQYTVMGASVNLASRLCGAARGSQILLTEATLREVLAHLPEGWESKTMRDTDPLEDATHDSEATGKVERFEVLAPELKGRAVLVGPGVRSDAPPILIFRYLYQLKVKGVREATPTLSVERPHANLPIDLPASTERPPPEPGERILGVYRLLEMVGRGGMGEVWKSRDRFGNIVAVKMLRLGAAATEGQIKRFRQEAEVLRHVTHRNICRVFEVGEADGVTYLAMEFIDGVSLSDLLRAGGPSSLKSFRDRGSDLASLVRGAAEERSRSATGSAASSERLVEVEHPTGNVRILPMTQTLSIVAQVAEAMQFAHERGVLHRDLKPGNVMLRADGEPVVMDFGLAKFDAGATSELSLSMSGQILGTLEYMAPEQAANSKGATERADIYSLGAILYLMLTGKRHFEATGNLISDARRLHDWDPPSVRRFNPLIDPDLEAIAAKTLHPDPMHRYATMRQFADDLRAFERGDPVSAKRPTWRYRIGKFVRKHRVPVTLTGVASFLLFLLAAILIGIYVQRWGDWVEIEELAYPPPPRPKSAGEAGVPWQWTDASARRDISPPAALGSGGGTVLPAGAWAWLSSADGWTQQDVRVTARVRITGNPPPALRLAIRTQREPLGPGVLPRGYVAEYAGFAGRLNILTANLAAEAERIANATPANYHEDAEVELLLELRDGIVRFEVDGKAILTHQQLLPPESQDAGQVALMAFERFDSPGTVELLDLHVYGLSLPLMASPIIAGDALWEAGDAASAIQRYIQIAEAYSKKPVGAEAWLRARALATLRPKFESEVARLDPLYPRDSLRKAIRARADFLDALSYWETGKYGEAITLAAFANRYDSTLRPAAALSDAKRPYLPTREAERFLELLQPETNLSALNLSGMGLRRIDTLEDKPLIVLDVSSNELTSLDPLRSMPLAYLRAGNNRISSLQPLTGAPLVLLDMGSNAIKDITPLRSMPLLSLVLDDNPVHDLEALRGSSIKSLFLNRTPPASLAPLTGVPLEELGIDGTQSLSVAPLSDAPLHTLWCNGASVRNIEALRKRRLLRVLGAERNGWSTIDALAGQPLDQLYLAENAIADLTPLRETKSLRYVFAPHNKIADLAPLAGHPLEAADFRDNLIASLDSLVAAPLDFLDIRANPISSLGLLAQRPPATFFFVTPSLPNDELKRLSETWSEASNQRLHTLARDARAELALRRQDRPKLEKLATSFENRRFLYLQRAVTWQQAQALASSVGARLAIIDSAACNAFFKSLVPPGESPWIGFWTDSRGKPSTAQGTAVAFHRLDGVPVPETGIRWTPGSWRAKHPGLPSGFVIEW
jgi:serine/threonine protein kinase/class 3 adenylate cyclase